MNVSLPRRLLTLSLCAVAALMAASPLPAATEITGDVPAELVRLILPGMPGAPTRIFSDLYDGFPLTELPDGFSVLGSVDMIYSRAAFLRSPLPAQEAEASLAAALEAQGWLRLPEQTFGTSQGGFVAAGAPATPRTPLTLCHDEQGNVTLASSESAGGPVLSLRQNQGQGQSCADMQQMRDRMMLRSTAMNQVQYMPRLELPEQASRPPLQALAGVGGFSSSGEVSETRTALRIDWSADQLYEHFARQLREQGWRAEGAWQSELSAGGHWRRDEEGGRALSGLLTILRVRDDDHRLQFQLQQR